VSEYRLTWTAPGEDVWGGSADCVNPDASTLDNRLAITDAMEFITEAGRVGNHESAASVTVKTDAEVLRVVVVVVAVALQAGEKPQSV
jgi:hypothetical protein